MHFTSINKYKRKLVPVLLLEKDGHFIVCIVRMINRYHLTLITVTYRALIAKLFDSDIDLSKYLYHTAVGLGIYFRIQVEQTDTY